MELRGIYTALVTPFANGALDEAALKKLIEFQLAQGVDGIVPTGTTGEASRTQPPAKIRPRNRTRNEDINGRIGPAAYR